MSANSYPPLRGKAACGTSGFSLLELMVAISVASLLGVFVAQFTIFNYRTLFDSTAKLHIAKDVRSFTSDISQTGRSARAFYIYPDFDKNQTAALRRTDGGTGDFLVFVWVEPDYSGSDPDHNTYYYSKMIAYGRKATSDEEGPVIRFEKSFPQTAAYRTNAKTVEGLLKETMEDNTVAMREVLELARGLANQKLFLNFRDNSVIVNGEILHGNSVRRVTNTYNFTITPRG